MGGMIAAVGSIFITPWNLFNNPQVIHYTIDILGAFIGPLLAYCSPIFTSLKTKIVVDDLYTLDTKGLYWYKNGYNHSAFYALIPASLIPILCVLLPQLSGLANFTWFIGMGFGFVIYRFLNQPLAHVKSAMTKVKVQ